MILKIKAVMRSLKFQFEKIRQIGAAKIQNRVIIVSSEAVQMKKSKNEIGPLITKLIETGLLITKLIEINQETEITNVEKAGQDPENIRKKVKVPLEIIIENRNEKVGLQIIGLVWLNEKVAVALEKKIATEKQKDKVVLLIIGKVDHRDISKFFFL